MFSRFEIPVPTISAFLHVGFCPGWMILGVVSGETQSCCWWHSGTPSSRRTTCPSDDSPACSTWTCGRTRRNPTTGNFKQALEENVDAEEETPYPKSEVEVLAPAELESPVEKDTAIPSYRKTSPLLTSPLLSLQEGKHRVAMKDYVKKVKASKHGPKGDAPTTEEPTLETLTASLPPKPADWGTFGQVTAWSTRATEGSGSQKEECRTRRGLQSKQPKSKARAKAAGKEPRGRSNKTEPYEPMSVEEDPRVNKGSLWCLCYSFCCCRRSCFGTKGKQQGQPGQTKALQWKLQWQGKEGTAEQGCRLGQQWRGQQKKEVRRNRGDKQA